MKQRLTLQEGELAAALRVPGMHIHTSFGPSGAWVVYDDQESLTPFVRFLLLHRGILNENTDGAGI